MLVCLNLWAMGALQNPQKVQGSAFEQLSLTLSPHPYSLGEANNVEMQGEPKIAK